MKGKRLSRRCERIASGWQKENWENFLHTSILTDKKNFAFSLCLSIVSKSKHVSIPFLVGVLYLFFSSFLLLILVSSFDGIIVYYSLSLSFSDLMFGISISFSFSFSVSSMSSVSSHCLTTSSSHAWLLLFTSPWKQCDGKLAIAAFDFFHGRKPFKKSIILLQMTLTGNCLQSVSACNLKLMSLYNLFVTLCNWPTSSSGPEKESLWRKFVSLSCQNHLSLY